MLFLSMPVERATNCVHDRRREMDKGARRRRLHEVDHPVPTESVGRLHRTCRRYDTVDLEIALGVSHFVPKSDPVQSTPEGYHCVATPDQFPYDYVHLAKPSWRHEH
jgi:hypothetical protein